MSKNASTPGSEGDVVTSVSSGAKGGTLAEYVDYLHATGRPAKLSPDGTQAFVPGARGELQRFPLECNESVDPDFVQELISIAGVHIVTYLLPASKTHVANCFDYVCDGPDYQIDDLSKNGRRDVRRGLRNFLVRLCSWDEIAKDGFPACADTFARHGYSAPDPSWFADMVAQLKRSQFHEVWGAWREDRLAAWMTVIKIDDWAIIDVARSCTELLKWCPNNAICFAATSRLIVEEKRKYVTYGLSSIQVDVNELSMHKYKIRMNYDPLPRCREFETGLLLRPVLKSATMSWVWGKLSKAFSGSSNLRKLAGMSRILSGREKSPLSWAESQPRR